jgi:DNA-binding NarL/FixJ family response regulator
MTGKEKMERLEKVNAILGEENCRRRALVLEQRQILNEMRKMPVSEYTVLYDLHVKGLSMKEVAYALKKSYSWVKEKKKNGYALMDDSV